MSRDKCLLTSNFWTSGASDSANSRPPIFPTCINEEKGFVTIQDVKTLFSPKKKSEDVGILNNELSASQRIKTIK